MSIALKGKGASYRSSIEGTKADPGY